MFNLMIVRADVMKHVRWVLFRCVSSASLHPFRLIVYMRTVSSCFFGTPLRPLRSVISYSKIPATDYGMRLARRLHGRVNEDIAEERYASINIGGLPVSLLEPP